MKVTGIIAEYNPFHKGHEYHLNQAKELSDYCIVVMSGDFVQRGEPAVYNKYLRTEAALYCGADLVLEMPSAFASCSAEDFASCGIALLTQLGVVDTLSFGSECGNIQPLMEAAQYLNEESREFSTLIKEHLKSGYTWPQARAMVLAQLQPISQEAEQALASPNNILGVEYCKAILRQNSPLQPVSILRQGKGYHDTQVPEGSFASAAALRQLLFENAATESQTLLSPYVPPETLKVYENAQPVYPNDFSQLLNYVLLSHVHQRKDLSVYEGMTEDLADRVQNLLLFQQNWEGRINQLKSKQYTYTRISRSLLHILLGITASQTALCRNAGYAPYARILGFRRDAAPLLSAVKNHSSIPVITKTADADKILTGTALSMIEQDFYCSHLWQSVYSQKYEQLPGNEYTQSVIIL